ncbi:MAG: NAD(P)H-dependent oxidoreductase subunit E [Acidimicrobiia bacterium]|nr:NAD(P)H-dependent oxidoreductase subunit E [Acidimicrobiia bacterium]
MDIKTTTDRPTDAERRAIDRVVGEPTSRWDDGELGEGSDHVAYGGYHRSASRRHLLLPALHAVQDAVGWVSHGAINYVSRRLGLGPAEAYGVATFYDLFATEAAPAVVAHVCDDIACLASGVGPMLDELEATLGPAGSMGDAGVWKRSPCLGQCDKGSAAFIQRAGGPNEVIAPVTTEQVIEVLGVNEATGATAGAVDADPVSDPGPILGAVPTGTDLDAYRSGGGYSALATALDRGPSWVVAEIETSRVRGRGGAAFPAGIKWRTVAGHEGVKFVVCNADESEPGTFKDRILMEATPFNVLEGLTIAGIATGAERGYCYIRGEYPDALTSMTAAIETAHRAGLLGENIGGSGVSFEVEIRRGAGAYICGEETALFNSIEGYRGEPRQKPPFPTDAGLFGRPTLVNNVETLANVPMVIRAGGAAYASIGTTESTGPKLFCVSGNVAAPGLYEVEFGATTRDLLEMAGGVTGVLRTVLLGGAAGSFIAGDQLDIPLTFEDTRAAGIGLGSGVVMAFDDSVDMTGVVARIAAFFGEESCGLCVPCRVGTVRQHESLGRLANGTDRPGELLILDELDHVLRDASVCGLGQAASTAIQSAIRLELI